MPEITPGVVGDYLRNLPVAIPTRKLYLAALRSFFDCLCERHVVVLNPAKSVRGERYQVVEGRTPALTPAEVRSLLARIKPWTALDLRERAVVATLTFTAVRAGAVGRLRLKDFIHEGGQHVLRFREKGNKIREIPVRHDLEKYLLDYIAAAGLDEFPRESPLFPTFRRPASPKESRDRRRQPYQPTGKPMTGVDIWRLVKRWLRRAGLPARFSPHSFRACTITDLLTQGVPLEDVQYLAGHADSRVTALYDRRRKEVTRNIVERISV